MDIEWGIDGIDGRIYILQARPGDGEAPRKRHCGPLSAEGHAELLATGRAIGQKIGTGHGAARQVVAEMERVPTATCSSPRSPIRTGSR